MSKKKSLPFNVATDLIAGVLVGFFLGLLIDNMLGTKPLWIIILTILGILGSMRNIYREMKNGS